LGEKIGAWSCFGGGLLAGEEEGWQVEERVVRKGKLTSIINRFRLKRGRLGGKGRKHGLVQKENPTKIVGGGGV